jgi:predicted amidophosphoribosyltransferase
MALSGFCTVCQRTVYVDAEATPICPVCSSPLLETAAGADELDPVPTDEAPQESVTAEK